MMRADSCVWSVLDGGGDLTGQGPVGREKWKGLRGGRMGLKAALRAQRPSILKETSAGGSSSGEGLLLLNFDSPLLFPSQPLLISALFLAPVSLPGGNRGIRGV